MTAIRALLVDDEEPARCRLRTMLGEFPDVEVVGEARDGEEAVHHIRESRPHLVFLDIQMPGRTGLEVAAALEPPRPSVIFCTAFDQYAVDAFETHAVDYLLKPLNHKRLSAAIGRVRETLVERERMTGELSRATATQARLLPQRMPSLTTLDFHGICRPAREVGGDYYDFLPLRDRRFGLAVGDVSGKGLFAGLLVAKLQATVQSIASRNDLAIGDLLREVNRVMLASTEPNRYATFFYGVYDDERRELCYVNAGHPPALLLRAGTDRPERLAANGSVIGLLEKVRFEPATLALAPGDRIVVYSDGVTEATDAGGEEFGMARLSAAVTRSAGRTAEASTHGILEEIDRFRGDTPAGDDLTLVVACVR